MERDEARFVLEVRTAGDRTWSKLAQIALEAPARIDDRALALSPFRDGRGLRPFGFLAGLRRAPYALSQAIRGDLVPA